MVPKLYVYENIVKTCVFVHIHNLAETILLLRSEQLNAAASQIRLKDTQNDLHRALRMKGIHRIILLLPNSANVLSSNFSYYSFHLTQWWLHLAFTLHYAVPLLWPVFLSLFVPQSTWFSASNFLARGQDQSTNLYWSMLTTNINIDPVGFQPCSKLFHFLTIYVATVVITTKRSTSGIKLLYCLE